MRAPKNLMGGSPPASTPGRLRQPGHVLCEQFFYLMFNWKPKHLYKKQ